MSKSIRILVVDDHPMLRNGIAALLATQEDMTLIAEASNGKEAVEKFRAHRPDITLMDLQMPEMNGLMKTLLDKELLDTIRAVHAGRKIISAEASYEVAEHSTDDPLTQGEVEILRLIAAGNANKEIAAQLSLTEDTVKGRVKSILSKLGANDRTHAAMIGVKRGIIES